MSANPYNDEILRLAKSAPGGGQTIVDGISAHAINPLCGDDCRVTAKLTGDVIVDIRHDTRGCVLCLAAAEKMICLAREKKLLSAMQGLWGEFCQMLKNNAPPPPGLELFIPVVARKSRHHCVLLPFEAAAKLPRQNISAPDLAQAATPPTSTGRHRPLRQSDN